MNDDKKFQQNEPEVKPRGMIFFVVIFITIIVFLFVSDFVSTKQEEKTFQEFKKLVEDNQFELENVLYHEGKGFTFSRKGDEKGKEYFVSIPENLEQTPEFALLLDLSGATYKRKNRFVSEFLPHLLIIAGVFFLIYFFFFRKLGQRGDGFMSFGKSRAKLVTPEMCDVTFDDVAGIQEALEEVQEVVNFLKKPSDFNRLGGRLPHGVLLVGPPGVGKTLLARAIAGEADVPFFSISGSDFVELFVGVGASRVRDLFARAKEKAPAIIFLDELDAIGRRRGAGLGGGHDEREQTLNSILVEMDGFEKQTGVIVIAATNREDVLDPALLRPGRFDRQIYVDFPDIKGREAILKVHARKIVMSDKVDLELMARSTPMATGADLENILNEAALIAVLDNKSAVDFESIEKAREKVMWGKEKISRVMSEEDRRITALHETGHVICAKLTPEVDPLHKVSIIPRGKSLGITMILPVKDQYSIGRGKFLANVVVMLAGRAAEELYGDDITSGASDDIKKASRLVRKMVCEWGMSEIVGLQNYQHDSEHVFLGRDFARESVHSEKALQKIDDEVDSMLKGAFDEAKRILGENKNIVDLMVESLLDLETLDSDQVDLVFEGKKPEASENKKDTSPAPAQESTDAAEAEPEDNDKSEENSSEE